MEERALDAYNQTLQQGISGIALVIAIGMVVLLVCGLPVLLFAALLFALAWRAERGE
jgi:hypothetical protein